MQSVGYTRANYLAHLHKVFGPNFQDEPGLSEFVGKVTSAVPDNQPSEVMKMYSKAELEKLQDWQLVALDKVMACTKNAPNFKELRDVMATREALKNNPGRVTVSVATPRRSYGGRIK